MQEKGWKLRVREDGVDHNRGSQMTASKRLPTISRKEMLYVLDEKGHS